MGKLILYLVIGIIIGLVIGFFVARATNEKDFRKKSSD